MGREFVLKKPFHSAKLYVSGLDGYELIHIEEEEYKLRFIRNDLTYDTILMDRDELRTLFNLLSREI